MLQDVDFANKANCIRLFLLLDMMTEIYAYETTTDPKYRVETLSPELELYATTIDQNLIEPTAEDTLLG